MKAFLEENGTIIVAAIIYRISKQKAHGFNRGMNATFYK